MDYLLILGIVLGTIYTNGLLFAFGVGRYFTNLAWQKCLYGAIVWPLAFYFGLKYINKKKGKEGEDET